MQRCRSFETSNRNGQWGTRGMAQVIEHLPSKHEVLSSNPTKKKKKNGQWATERPGDAKCLVSECGWQAQGALQ
jgi:hypothetical protein